MIRYILTDQMMRLRPSDNQRAKRFERALVFVCNERRRHLYRRSVNPKKRRQ